MHKMHLLRQKFLKNTDSKSIEHIHQWQLTIDEKFLKKFVNIYDQNIGVC